MAAVCVLGSTGGSARSSPTVPSSIRSEGTVAETSVDTPQHLLAQFVGDQTFEEPTHRSVQILGGGQQLADIELRDALAGGPVAVNIQQEERSGDRCRTLEFSAGIDGVAVSGAVAQDPSPLGAGREDVDALPLHGLEAKFFADLGGAHQAGVHPPPPV